MGVIEMAMIGWLFAFTLGLGIFGLAVEICGPEWVDALWERWERRRRR